jgi:hypothetical protein
MLSMLIEGLFSTCMQLVKEPIEHGWGDLRGGVRDTGLAPSVSVGASNNIGFKDTTSLRLV